MKGGHSNDINSVLVKISKVIETEQNSHCTPLVSAHRFFPPHAHCFSISRLEVSVVSHGGFFSQLWEFL